MKCTICGKKEAIIQCDFPVNSTLFDFPDEEGKKVPIQKQKTCDAYICEDCAIEIEKDVHICKSCTEKFIRKALPTLPDYVVRRHGKFKKYYKSEDK